MRKLILLFLVVSIVTSYQCRENNTETSVDLVFEATYNNAILEYEKEYRLLNDKKVTITRSDFFMSDVRLINNNGSEYKLFDVEQVDFEAAPGGIRFNIKDVPEGNYESIRFNLGLTPEINATKPVDYPSTSPLTKSGYYWSAWDSYIFTKTEGRVEDDEGNLTVGWIFHTGTDPLMREVSIPVDMAIVAGDDNEIRIGLEHSGLFVKNGETVALGIVHDPTDVAVLGKFMDRIVTGFSLK